MLLFAAYVVLLVWTVLWKLHAPYLGRDDMREIKLIPFVAGGGFGASAPFEVAMNVLIFVPFGVYLGVLAATWPAWRVAGVLAGASVALEVAEYALAVGSSDVTDVIVNTVGGLAGWGMLWPVRRRLRAGRPDARSTEARSTALVTRFCVIGTVAVVVAVGIHIGSFPQLPPPGGIGDGAGVGDAIYIR